MSNSPKTISILGATGSIGASTLRAVDANPDGFTIDTLVAGRDANTLAMLAKKYHAKHAVIADKTQYQTLKDALANTATTVAAGDAALLEAAARPVDVCIAAITGMAGLKPALAAIGNANVLALANKEAVVCGGAFFMEAVNNSSTTLLPVDSEHHAVFKLLQSTDKNIESITLTASGGPFHGWTVEQLASVTPAQALKHPTWDMGSKISIDSATMMNKGLEVIEAAYLFDLPAEKIKTVVHPESIIHAMATYTDGSTLAHMGEADMIGPIGHALYWPGVNQAGVVPLRFGDTCQSLTFKPVDTAAFPCLRLAYEALGSSPAAMITLNMANELAVASFLREEIQFTKIPEIIEECVGRFHDFSVSSIEDVFTLAAEVKSAYVQLMKQPTFAA